MADDPSGGAVAELSTSGADETMADNAAEGGGAVSSQCPVATASTWQEYPILLNEHLRIVSYDGGSQQGRAQFDIKHALTPLADCYHCSGAGTKFSLLLECSQDFTLTHVYVAGPDSRSSEPVRSGLVWVCDKQPEVEQARRYDSLNQEELRGTAAGALNAVAPPDGADADAGVADANVADSGAAGPGVAEDSLGPPCVCFTTDSGSHQVELELPRWAEGRYVLVRFLDTHGTQERLELGSLSLIGILGRHAPRPSGPLGPWMRRSVRKPWVHPGLLSATFSGGGWVCDGRDFAGGCRSGMTDFHQTSVYTVTFRCAASGFDLCEACARDPTLGQATETAVQADVQAFRDPKTCRLACPRLSNVLRGSWLVALPRYFSAGLLDAIASALACSSCDEGVPGQLQHGGLVAGARVEARYMLSSGRVTSRWYPGRLVGRNEDGTYRVDYDDGDKWYSVPQEFVACRGGAASASQRPEVLRGAIRQALLQLIREIAQKLCGQPGTCLAVGDQVWARCPGSERCEEACVLGLPASPGAADAASAGSAEDDAHAGQCFVSWRDGRAPAWVPAAEVWRASGTRGAMAATSALYAELVRGEAADAAAIARALQRGADLSVVDGAGCPPLLVAVRSGALQEVVAKLLDAGACPDASGPSGVTPLQEAAAQTASADQVAGPDAPAEGAAGAGARAVAVADMLRRSGATRPPEGSPAECLERLRERLGRGLLGPLLQQHLPELQTSDALESVHLLVRDLPLQTLLDVLSEPAARRALAALLQHFVGSADGLKTVLFGCRICRALCARPDEGLRYLVCSHGVARWARRLSSLRVAGTSVNQPQVQPPGVQHGLATLQQGRLSSALSLALQSQQQQQQQQTQQRLAMEELGREAAALRSALQALGSAADEQDAEEHVAAISRAEGWVSSRRLVNTLKELGRCDGSLGCADPGAAALLVLSELLVEPDQACTAYECERLDAAGRLLRFLRLGDIPGQASDRVDEERWAAFRSAFGGPCVAQAACPGAARQLVTALQAVVETGEGFAVWHHRRDRGLKALVDPVQVKLKPCQGPRCMQPFVPPVLQPQLALMVEPLALVRDLCRYLLRVTPVVEERYLAYCHEIVGSTIFDRCSGELHEVVDFTVLHSDIPLPVHSLRPKSGGAPRRVVLSMREHELRAAAPQRPAKVELKVRLCQLHGALGSAAYAALLPRLLQEAGADARERVEGAEDLATQPEAVHQAQAQALTVVAADAEGALPILRAELERLSQGVADSGTATGDAPTEAVVHPHARVHSVAITASEELPFDTIWPMVREDIMDAVREVCRRGQQRPEDAICAGVLQSGSGVIAERLTLEEAQTLAARVGHVVQTAVSVDTAAVQELQRERARRSDAGGMKLGTRAQFLSEPGGKWLPCVISACSQPQNRARGAQRTYDVIDDEGVLIESLPGSRVQASRSSRSRGGGLVATRPARGSPPRREGLFAELARRREQLRQRREENEDEPEEEESDGDAAEPPIPAVTGLDGGLASPNAASPTSASPIGATASAGPMAAVRMAAQAAFFAVAAPTPPSQPQPRESPPPPPPPRAARGGGSGGVAALQREGRGASPPSDEEARLFERLRALEQILPDELLRGPLASLRALRRAGSGSSLGGSDRPTAGDGSEPGEGPPWQFEPLLLRRLTGGPGGPRGDGDVPTRGDVAAVLRGELPAFARAADMSQPAVSLDHPVVQRLGKVELAEEQEERMDESSPSGSSAAALRQPPALVVRLCLLPPSATTQSMDAASQESQPATVAGLPGAAPQQEPAEPTAPIPLPPTWTLSRAMQFLQDQQRSSQAAHGGPPPAPRRVPLDKWSLGFVFCCAGEAPVARAVRDHFQSASAPMEVDVGSSALAITMEPELVVQPCGSPPPSPGRPPKRRRTLAGVAAGWATDREPGRCVDVAASGDPAGLIHSCGANPAVVNALELLRLLHSRRGELGDVELCSSPGPWLSQKLDRKLQAQLDDPLSTVAGALPAWAAALPRLCPFLIRLEVRKRLLRYTALGPSFAVHWIQEGKLGPTLRRRAAVQTELNAQADPRKVQELSQELSNLEEHIVRSNSWLGTLESALVRVQKGEDLLRQSERALELLATSGRLMEVQFEGETGFGSAVTQSFYVEVSLALQERETNRQVPLWVEDDGSTASKYLLCRRGLLIRPLTAGPQREAAARRFLFLGRLLGQALREGFIVPLPLSEELFALVLGQRLGPECLPRPGGGSSGELCGTLADIAASLGAKEDDSAEYPDATLPGRLAEHAASPEEYLDLVGACFLETGLGGAQLCPGGGAVPVTCENVAAFVEQATTFWFDTGVSEQMEALRAGLSEAVPIESLRAFSPAELHDMFCGEDHVEWDERALLAHLHPVGGLTSRSPLFGHLVALLLEMDQANRSRFLEFVTSCPRLPPGGIANFHIDVFPDPGCRRGYPRSRACANQLYLPPYVSKEELKERLHEAMHSSAGHHEQRMRDL